MNIDTYFEKMTKIQNTIEEFLDNKEDCEENYEKINQIFSTEEIFKDKSQSKELLYLLRSIFKNHNRQNDMIHKIEQIIKQNKTTIKDRFTNIELFDIFKNEKLILLFLIKEQIIHIDETIFDQLTKNKFQKRKYLEYFYPEIKEYLKENNIDTSNYEKESQSPNYEHNREEGENENYICKIIREDLIEEFIIYINKNDYSINSEIEESIYETNSIFLKERARLIEYAAFYGSVQIFKYLFLNKADISGKIWIYAVHSDNPEMIVFLEDNQIKPEDLTYQEVLNESIKCHHQDVTNYIIDKFIENEDENKYDENIYSYSFHYRNYIYFPKQMNYKYIFFYACQYNYYNIVEYFMKYKNINIKDTVIP